MTPRLRALLAKELADLGRNPGVFVPAILTSLLSLAMPFFVAIAVPALTGEPLAESNDLEAVAELFRSLPVTSGLDAEAAAQAFVFHQFLVLLVLGPVAASMATAAFSVIGEKQARTLEPLLATPVTTTELLLAKVLGAFVPALTLTVLLYLTTLAGVVALARPGVHRVLLVPEALTMLFVAGPLAALAALQMAVCVSSRTNDPRSAQQIGALIILPVAGLIVAQAMGGLVLTLPLALGISAGLLVLNLALLRLGVVLFDRESILTRWT